ncbi:MAG TPA: LUD domain-containing protein [Gaiellaceae bacterium]|nr:LUD domain-containing protein [Gaiellaceae bacterium]
MSEARAEILRRVAAATRGAAGPEGARPAYRRTLGLGPDELVERFCERARDYRAELHRVAAADVAGAVAAVCRERGVTRLVAPAGLPPAWRPDGVELVADEPPLAPRELDLIGGALTGCTLAVAESGTVVLAGSPHEGRRALTLVPDLHVCVVEEARVVGLLPEALELLEREGLERRPLTFVSGPSATSDIELSRVEGVHGPRDLVLVVAARA